MFSTTINVSKLEPRDPYDPIHLLRLEIRPDSLYQLLPCGFRIWLQVALSFGLGKLCVFVLGIPLTALSQRLSSVSVHVSGSACSMLDLLSYMESISLPPEGSFSAGNMSPPHMFHNEVKVTMPANPMYCQLRKAKESNMAQTKEQVLPSCQHIDVTRSIELEAYPGLHGAINGSWHFLQHAGYLVDRDKTTEFKAVTSSPIKSNSNVSVLPDVLLAQGQIDLQQIQPIRETPRFCRPCPQIE